MNATLLGMLTCLALPPDGARDPSKAAPITLAITGECPGEAGVTAALVPLLKLDSLRPADGPPRVVDLGDRFEVTAAGQVGVYTDVGRDCSERARVAAVFIALALNPPTFQPRPARPSTGLPPPPKEEKSDDTRDDRKEIEDSRASPAPVIVAPRTPDRPAVLWARLAVGGRLEAAPDASGRPGTTGALGVDLEAAGGLDDFGVAIGAGVRTATVSTFSSAAVREQRFPFSVAAVGRTHVAKAVELVGDVGLTLVILRLTDESPGAFSPATRLDLGARAGVALRLPALSPRVSPFAGASIEYFPRPYRYEVEPLGPVGNSAPVWLGLSLGLWFQRL